MRSMALARALLLVRAKGKADNDRTLRLKLELRFRSDPRRTFANRVLLGSIPEIRDLAGRANQACQSTGRDRGVPLQKARSLAHRITRLDPLGGIYSVGLWQKGPSKNTLVRPRRIVPISIVIRHSDGFWPPDQVSLDVRHENSSLNGRRHSLLTTRKTVSLR